MSYFEQRSSGTVLLPAARRLSLTPSSKEKHGSAVAIYVSPNDVARFWSKVSKGDGCWEWQAGLFRRTGYGQFSVGGKDGRHVSAHRVAWLIQTGEDPSLCVLHRCDNRRCVRPDHLFLGTVGDNHADMVSKARGGYGEALGRTIRNAEVPEIRRRIASGERQADIAADYGVTPSAISLIKRGRIFRRIA